MSCPYCGTEMPLSHLNCGASLWSGRKHRFSLPANETERCALFLGHAAMSRTTLRAAAAPMSASPLDAGPCPSRLKHGRMEYSVS